jgi:hypothetical protein
MVLLKCRFEFQVDLGGVESYFKYRKKYRSPGERERENERERDRERERDTCAKKFLSMNPLRFSLSFSSLFLPLSSSFFNSRFHLPLFSQLWHAPSITDIMIQVFIASPKAHLILSYPFM